MGAGVVEGGGSWTLSLEVMVVAIPRWSSYDRLCPASRDSSVDRTDGSTVLLGSMLKYNLGTVVAETCDLNVPRIFGSWN